LSCAVSKLPNTAENGYFPLTYQARCTPVSAGAWPANFRVNLTASQYSSCGQDNLAVSTNSTTVTVTSRPVVTVTGPATASVCSNAASTAALAYTLASSPVAASSFSATASSSSVACSVGKGVPVAHLRRVVLAAQLLQACYRTPGTVLA
jgi:hypothetical protein